MCYYFVIFGEDKITHYCHQCFQQGVCGPLGVHQATPGGLGEDIRFHDIYNYFLNS